MRVINPSNGLPLARVGDVLVDAQDNRFPIVKDVARFAGSNYANSFGFQWNLYQTTQLDTDRSDLSAARLFAQTGWAPGALSGLDVLEVGSGAGRFSRVILEHTGANLWSVDYSSAVDANYASNGGIAPGRFHLYQASIYALPFADDSFDKVLCLGVLQHTPDFEASVGALVSKAKRGAEIVLDFYPINGWWTKLHSKYILRRMTRGMKTERLHRLIAGNISWLMRLFDALCRLKLGVLTRFVPITDLRLFPPTLSRAERREWAIMDTLDALSPEYDQPQRVRDVEQMLTRAGARVTFAGLVSYRTSDGAAFESIVVRALKQ